MYKDISCLNEEIGTQQNNFFLSKSKYILYILEA